MSFRILFLKKYLILYLVLLFFSSCNFLEKPQKITSFPKKSIAKKTKAVEKQTWKQIKKQTSKPLSERIKEIEDFIKSNADKEIALQAYLLKAKILLKNNKSKQACLSYHEVVKSPFNYSNQWEAYQASAKCYMKDKKIKKALETLERFIQTPKENLTHKKASAKIQWSLLKKRKGYIRWKLNILSHLSLFSLQAKEKQKWQNQGEKLINSLSPDTLRLYANQAGLFSPFEGYLFYKMGEYFWTEKKIDKSKIYFKKALSSELTPHLKKMAEKKLSLIKKISKVNPYLIGVIVPLSGQRKALGEKVLRGLYMGLNMDKGSPWQIVVMDSKSHPDVVRTHLDSLFYKHHVIGVVGGLTSETAEVIAEQAEIFTIPAILFSQKKDLSLNRIFVFQNAITAKQLLTPLIDELIKNLKVEKTAVFYADDPYGKEYSEQFSKILKEKGGTVIQSEIYKTGEMDFKKHIKNLLHLNIKGREKEFERLKRRFLKDRPSLSERSSKLTPENLLPAKQDFKALFIPDSLNQLEKIKDHLKYFGVKNIYLLGTNLWNQNKFSSWPKELPLVFVNLPEKNNRVLTSSTFYKNFINLYIQPPGLFEQRAYNSAVFLKEALEKGVKSRLSLQRELKKIKNFQGAYYKISISKDQVFNYPISLYKIGFN